MNSPEVNDSSDVWKNQHTWSIQSWKLYSFSGVHVLETVSGLVFTWFVDKWYSPGQHYRKGDASDHQLEFCHGKGEFMKVAAFGVHAVTFLLLLQRLSSAIMVFLIHEAMKFGLRMLLFNLWSFQKKGSYLERTMYVVPTSRVKVLAGRYVVPTGRVKKVPVVGIKAMVILLNPIS
ncbi:hypothetical protein Tco_0287149 [Tanacetum coccineum]